MSVQRRRCVHLPASLADRFYARAAQLGVSASSLMEVVLADPTTEQARACDRPRPAGRPTKVVESIATPLTPNERSVLRALPGLPSWSWTDEVVGAVRRRMGRLSAIEALDSLLVRGLVRRKRQTGRQAKWQRIGDAP